MLLGKSLFTLSLTAGMEARLMCTQMGIHVHVFKVTCEVLRGVFDIESGNRLW